ncbi:unnamed protein product, partial [Staurois parvus]
WAQVGGTGGHRWVALVGTGRWHCRVAQVGALLGTGGGTAGHRWGHCWERVGGASGRTAGRNLRDVTSGTDHQGTDHQCPDDRCRSPLTTAGSRAVLFPHDLNSVRKVQPRTGTC